MASIAPSGNAPAYDPFHARQGSDAAGISGTIAPVDEDPDKAMKNDDDGDDDDDDDIAPSHRRRVAPSAPRPTADDDEDEDGKIDDDDLFGDGGDDEPQSKTRRQLDDEELDSGDDVGRADRVQDDYEMQDAAQEEQVNIESAEMYRHVVPHSSDGELYLLKVPNFLGIEPKPFEPQTFTAPVTDHHSKTEASPAFNSYKTALSTIRWRKSPSNPSNIQSNARLLRWSDGSITLQLASQPSRQYKVPGATAAPPQLDPKKPTPTAIYSSDKKNRTKVNRTNRYHAEKDSFTYLAAPQANAQVLRITNKVTTTLQVQPAGDSNEQALIKLQQSLAAAANRNRASDDAEGSGMEVINVTEDPELLKKRAELAEKEKERLRRRRLAQEERLRERTDRTLGRGFGADSIDDGYLAGAIGDDDGEGRQRLPPVRGRKKAKAARNRRGEIYTDDEEEEYGRRGHTREDEYDEEDDFLAPSDEEEEVVEDDDEDVDEGITLQATQGRAQRKRSVSEEDAEGEPDEDEGAAAAAAANAGSPVVRGKRRRVVDDDDDDDDEE